MATLAWGSHDMLRKIAVARSCRPLLSPHRALFERAIQSLQVGVSVIANRRDSVAKAGQRAAQYLRQDWQATNRVCWRTEHDFHSPNNHR